jgi:hypothetical protein
MPGRPLLASVSLASLVGCGDGVGEPGTRFPEPLSELSGGFVFSTSVIGGAEGYDLFWAPAGTSGEQPVVQLTSAGGHDYQPSVAASGAALVFAREDRGILRVDAEGRVSAVTDTRDTTFVDSQPVLDPSGQRVAWVRQDTARTIPETSFFPTEIWIADADGARARPVSPKREVVQDAPAFDPGMGRNRLAWSEFNATTLGPNGPVDYGVWLHDLDTAGGRFICEGAWELEGVGVVRCFGQHLSWPRPSRIVLDQQLLLIDPATGDLGSLLPDLLAGLANATGSAERSPSPSGFFPPFPLSASFLGDRMMVDGVFNPFDGDLPTLAFFRATDLANNPARVRVAGHRGDIDPGLTSGYLFSLATPQLMP